MSPLGPSIRRGRGGRGVGVWWGVKEGRREVTCARGRLFGVGCLRRRSFLRPKAKRCADLVSFDTERIPQSRKGGAPRGLDLDHGKVCACACCAIPMLLGRWQCSRQRSCRYAGDICQSVIEGD